MKGFRICARIAKNNLQNVLVRMEKGIFVTFPILMHSPIWQLLLPASCRSLMWCLSVSILLLYLKIWAKNIIVGLTMFLWFHLSLNCIKIVSNPTDHFVVGCEPLWTYCIWILSIIGMYTSNIKRKNCSGRCETETWWFLYGLNSTDLTEKNHSPRFTKIDFVCTKLVDS